MNIKYTHTVFKAFLCLSAIFLFSCDDYLDETPDNRLELDTVDKIKKALASAYPQSSYFLLTEMASDNADENSATSHSAYNKSQEYSYRWEDVISEDNDSPYDIWSKFYVAIQTACAVIDALDELEAKGEVKDQSEADGIRSEALLCRAYGHFVLVNLFSKTYGDTSDTDLGIPYVFHAEENLVVEYGRGTVSQVYSYINDDIEDALINVKKINQSIRKYHWNKEAAYAFAARFNLFYKDYDKAIRYATVVLGDDPASVLRDWASDGVTALNNDVAYNLYVSVDQTANLLLLPAESVWGRVSGPYALGNKYALQSITMQEIAPNAALPVGGALKYSYSTLLNGALVVSRKVGEYFEYYDKLSGTGWTHIVQALFTTDETLFVRAEAYALSGNLNAAVEDLDTFTRAYTYYRNNLSASKESLIDYYSSLSDYDPTDYNSVSPKKKLNVAGLTSDQEYVLQGILQSKRMLTVHEGHRWFDIRRYGIEIYRRTTYNGVLVTTDKLSVDDPRRTFQIPQQMVAAGIQANPR